MGLFQKGLQLVLQPHPVAPQLVLLARYRPPQTLLGIRHKAQRQFSSHQPLHQAFGIDEISLSSAPPAPDVVFPTYGVRLLASRTLASNTVPVLPKLVSNIA